MRERALMRVVRNVLIYLVLFGVLGMAMTVLASVPLISNDIVLGLVVLPLAAWAVTSVGRRLTGWPVRKPQADLPLPIEGDGGNWNVSLYDPRPKTSALAQYLTKEHRVTPTAAFASVAHDPLPLLLAQSMSEEAAVKLASDLRGLGASVGVREQHN